MGAEANRDLRVGQRDIRVVVGLLGQNGDPYYETQPGEEISRRKNLQEPRSALEVATLPTVEG